MQKLIDDIISTNIIYSIDILNIKNNELDNTYCKFLLTLNKNNKNNKKEINIKFDKLFSVTNFPCEYQTGLLQNQNLSNHDFYELIMKQIFQSNIISSNVVIRYINNCERFEFYIDQINDIYSKDKKKINKLDKLKIEKYENDKLKLIQLLNNILKLDE